MKIISPPRVELILLGANFERIKTIEAFDSLLWTENYYDAGTFELYCGFRYLRYFLEATHVYRHDTNRLAVINYIKPDEQTGSVIIKGGLIENELKTRVLDQAAKLSGTVEDVCRLLVEKYCMTGGRAIPRLALGEPFGLTEVIEAQRTGKTVFDVLAELLYSREASFRLRFDFGERMLYFELFQGIDRTVSQSANTRCLFSTERNNVLSETYETSRDTRNFAYVAGAGEGDARAVVTIDQTDGGPRRELYVDARDIQPTEAAPAGSVAYNQLLINRGQEKLSEWNIADTVGVEIDMYNAPKFALGDKCSYRGSFRIQGNFDPVLGVEAEGRVTKIYEVLEPSEISKTVTLGKEQLQVKQALKRSFGT
ncbi:MAG: siphovirus ReqiPepy6 Gp37-like family protein [Clostridiales bacterium]|jgi:hypothetical protein|nr:siphovirus ReqiPepy6 Gp37-like family protein [Clostridiales bacterium]